jgi:hypothetical protein
MQLVALTSALSLVGGAIAQDVNRTITDDTGAASIHEAPAAGAIVTPEDKAAGMGKHDGQAGNRSDDTSTANDDISVNPGSSGDDITVNPGTTNDDISISPDRDNDARVAPSRGNRDDTSNTAGQVRPSDMGPGNLRGQ